MDGGEKANRVSNAAAALNVPAVTADAVGTDLGETELEGPSEANEEEEEEQDKQQAVDITETHFKYTKLRSAFGKQTQFLEDRPRIHCGLRANTARYHPLFQQQQFVNKAEETFEVLRDLSTNTPRTEYRSFAVLHQEGGWPKEINVKETEIVEKTRRKLQKEDSFVDAVQNLTREAEYLVKHNNTLALCDPHFKRSYVQKRDTKPTANVVEVYKCPSPKKRPVSRISFSPGNTGRMAAAYCPYEFDTTFREHSCQAFYWEVTNPAEPTGSVWAAAQVVDVKYHPADMHNICGALFTGQVCTWDTRVGSKPQAISSFETSHADVCTNAIWNSAEAGTHDFFSAGLDGQIIWWDDRNLNERLDVVYSDVGKRNNPKQAVPITALEYDHRLNKKFIVGTQFGQVMPFAREETKVKKKPKEDPREPDRVPSLLNSEEEGDEEDEDEDEDDEEDVEEGNEEEEEMRAEEEKEVKVREGEEEDEGDEEEWDEEEGEEEEGDEGEDAYLNFNYRTPPPEEEEEEIIIGPFKGVTVYKAHRGPIVAIKRNPAFPENFVSCGGFRLKVFSEDVLESEIMCTSPSDVLYSHCQWLLGRPSCIVASRIDGCLEFWDFLAQGSRSIFTTKICDEALSTVTPSNNGFHIAVGAVDGDIRMVQVCPFLAGFSDSDTDALEEMFWRETRRVQFLEEKRRQDIKSSKAGARKKPTPASKQEPKPATVDPLEKPPLRKPEPYKDPEILTDKTFFDMLAEEKKRQGVNAFPDKREAAEAYTKMLVEGRMNAKKDAMEKANKMSDSELGAKTLMDVTDSSLRKADEMLGETDDMIDPSLRKVDEVLGEGNEEWELDMEEELLEEEEEP